MTDAATSASSETAKEQFDLRKYGQDAAIEHLRMQSFYGDLAEVVARMGALKSGGRRRQFGDGGAQPLRGSYQIGE